MTNNRKLTAEPDAASSGVFSLADLINAAKRQDAGEGSPPVEKWHPEFCGEMDLIIKADGSWWHEGSPIGREKLVKLFSTILRKDEDGRHYLVTPYEKIGIQVERAAFTIVRLDNEGEGASQQLFFTSNVGEVIALSPKRPLRVETDARTQEPAPFIAVRGRLEASLARSVFYELVDMASEIDTPHGPQLGVYSAGVFFPLGPAGIHVTD